MRSEFHSPNMDSDIYKFVYISYSILACKLTHHFSAWAYVTICDGSYMSNSVKWVGEHDVLSNLI